jgi:hypothetical protein
MYDYIFPVYKSENITCTDNSNMIKYIFEFIHNDKLQDAFKKHYNQLVLLNSKEQSILKEKIKEKKEKEFEKLWPKKPRYSAYKVNKM